MNLHLTDGQLRADLDSELDAQSRQHLDQCARCQARQAEMRTHIRQTTDRLRFLSSDQTSVPSATAAWKHFQQRKVLPKETPMSKKLFASPLFRFGLPALLALTLIVAVPGARAFASQLLDLFRVQRVTILPIDPTGMERLNGNYGNQLSDLVSASITMNQEPSDPVEVADAQQASELAGFNVRVPQTEAPTRIEVVSGADFSIKIDREQAQALLEEAGRNDLVLPESIDGANVSVEIPASVSLAYGTCPKLEKEGDGFPEEGSPGRRYRDCILVAQIPSPTVSAPPNLDIAQLARIALEFGGMTPEQATEFTETVDWTSTLVIPIPRNAASYQEVQVDGVTGSLIERPSDDAPQFALIWVKDGIIYTVAGRGNNAQRAIDLANTLP